jgi:hypothetical protein
MHVCVNKSLHTCVSTSIYIYIIQIHNNITIMCMYIWYYIVQTKYKRNIGFLPIYQAFRCWDLSPISVATYPNWHHLWWGRPVRLWFAQEASFNLSRSSFSWPNYKDQRSDGLGISPKKWEFGNMIILNYHPWTNFGTLNIWWFGDDSPDAPYLCPWWPCGDVNII